MSCRPPIGVTQSSGLCAITSQQEIRTCKPSTQIQISHSWVTFKPWHCPWSTHNICVDLIHKSQLATATKRPGERRNYREKTKKTTTLFQCVNWPKRKRCRDNVYSEWMGEKRDGNKGKGQIGGIWAGFTLLMLTSNLGQFSGQSWTLGLIACIG